jgi:outer membrane protein TolC
MLSDMFPRWGSRSVQVSPSVQWNILNYGQITNSIRVQDARFQQLLLAYQRTVLASQHDVEDNLVAFLRAQDRTDLLARSVTSSRVAVDPGRGYRAGRDQSGDATAHELGRPAGPRSLQPAGLASAAVCARFPDW